MSYFGRAFRSVAPALAVCMMAGCAAQQVSEVNQKPREEITFAALAKYPTTAPSVDKDEIVALDSPDNNMLYVYNLSDKPIPQCSLWVNKTFVRQIDGVPPKGHVAVAYSDLIQAGPGVMDLKQSGQQINQVDLQTPQGLAPALGPAYR